MLIIEDEIDAEMALAWELMQPAPDNCKTISELKKENKKK